jgi:hypothetical protein
MIVGLLASDAAPANCGVAAYVTRLSTELGRQGHEVFSVAANGAPDALVSPRLGSQWTMFDAPRLRATLRSAGVERVVFNWTPAVYGRRALGADVALLPAAVAWPRSCMVVVHEAESAGERWFDSVRRAAQKASLRVLAQTCTRLISPSTEDRFASSLQVARSPFGAVWEIEAVTGRRASSLLVFASPLGEGTTAVANAAARLGRPITLLGDDRASGSNDRFLDQCAQAGVAVRATGPLPDAELIAELQAAGAVIICKNKPPDMKWTTMTGALASGAPTIVVDAQAPGSAWARTIAGFRFPNLGIARNSSDIVDLLDQPAGFDGIGDEEHRMLTSGLWASHAASLMVS